MKDILVTKQNGEREKFDPAKLVNSLQKAGTDDATVRSIVKEVSAGLYDGITTDSIYRKAFALLRKTARPVAARYSMKRAVLELGPSGFPFEKFIGEIFKAKGFEVRTDVTVPGLCVEHEVDLVASKEGKHILAEIKFHNELGLKSDLKVALYVDARLEDIHAMRQKHGDSRVDEGWLITNTKFTKSATAYAECKGLTMVGWNHPRYGNLHELIEETGVHPLTCLTTLSRREKASLMEQGVVLCKAVEDNRVALEAAGVRGARVERVIEEGKRVCQPHF